MPDAYQEGLALYKLKKYKEANAKFASVAKAHDKYGHAQVASKKLTRMLTDDFSMTKHTAEERQKIKEEKSKNIDKYYKKSADAKKKEEARKKAAKKIVGVPSEEKS